MFRGGGRRFRVVKILILFLARPEYEGPDDAGEQEGTMILTFHHSLGTAPPH